MMQSGWTFHRLQDRQAWLLKLINAYGMNRHEGMKRVRGCVDVLAILFLPGECQHLQVCWLAVDAPSAFESADECVIRELETRRLGCGVHLRWQRWQCIWQWKKRDYRRKRY